MDLDRIASVNGPLLSWYALHARKLPWRDDPSAYHVWVSEIMLQQTRVEAVKPYYARFLQALPSIADLAACPEEKLLKLWEGLGYYSRVRNMKKCAQVLTDQFGGQMPMEYEELIRLPGIGSYTAGAIASIAFHRPVPAVDGNVLRVISRVISCEEDILLPSVKARTEAALRETIPKKEAGAFNQALMDLGASVCLPSARGTVRARCSECPLKEVCLSYQKDIVDRIPVRIVKTRRSVQEKTVLVISDGERAVLGKRKNKGLLAGMYELPNLGGRCPEGEVIRFVQDLGVLPLRVQSLPDASHMFTHLEWKMSGYSVLVEDLEDTAHIKEPYIMVEIGRIGTDYAIPSAFRAFTAYLAYSSTSARQP